MEIYSVRLLVRGMTIGFTAKDASHPHLDLRTIGHQIEVLRKLGYSDEIEVVFCDINDKSVPIYWWAEEDYDGNTYLDYYLTEDDDGLAAIEDATEQYLNDRNGYAIRWEV
jgi:hypothetical protein